MTINRRVGNEVVQVCLGRAGIAATGLASRNCQLSEELERLTARKRARPKPPIETPKDFAW
jgi:hypothetical protein